MRLRLYMTSMSVGSSKLRILSSLTVPLIPLSDIKSLLPRYCPCHVTVPSAQPPCHTTTPMPRYNPHATLQSPCHGTIPPCRVAVPSFTLHSLPGYSPLAMVTLHRYVTYRHLTYRYASLRYVSSRYVSQSNDYKN